MPLLRLKKEFVDKSSTQTKALIIVSLVSSLFCSGCVYSALVESIINAKKPKKVRYDKRFTVKIVKKRKNSKLKEGVKMNLRYIFLSIIFQMTSSLIHGNELSCVINEFRYLDKGRLSQKGKVFDSKTGKGIIINTKTGEIKGALSNADKTNKPVVVSRFSSKNKLALRAFTVYKPDNVRMDTLFLLPERKNKSSFYLTTGFEVFSGQCNKLN